MLSNHDAITCELEKLEVRFLANQDPNLSFALFADFLDAPERDQPRDAALIDVASEWHRELSNEKRYLRLNFSACFTGSKRSGLNREECSRSDGSTEAGQD